MNENASELNFDIGSRIGLWEITGPPTLGASGEVVCRSKYPCICHGCGKSFQVQRVYMTRGISKGCRSCRQRENMKRRWQPGGDLATNPPRSKRKEKS